MPADITDKTEAKFAIFFMLPVSQTQAYNDELTSQIKDAYFIMVVIIFALLSIVMLSIYGIILLYSMKIIAPIKKL